MDVDSSKTLKRCLSVPIIQNLPPTATTRSAGGTTSTVTSLPITNSSREIAKCTQTAIIQQLPDSSSMTSKSSTLVRANSGGIVHSTNPPSREMSPAPAPCFNIFAPRARRYSASYSSLSTVVAAGAIANSSNGNNGPRLTPRVSQLRQEECVDMNSREVNHEREIHNAIQMSQSWEDLTLVAENWSCKSDEMSNPLQVTLPTGVSSCSSPSPTSNRAGLRLLYGLSPSPTRRTFATRRSMSPIAMRPSQLGPVKRKFELDENSSNWNVYSQPPTKKVFTESRGSSPICQSPSSVCPSPDSGTYDGRITPKLFISKLCTTNTTSNSACSSPMSASSVIDGGIDMQHSSSSGTATPSSSSVSGNSEQMCVGAFDEGISESLKLQSKSRIISVDNDETLLDDIKSETSSICGGSISGSESCDSGKPTSFLNRLNVKPMAIDDEDQRFTPTTSTSIDAHLQKNFFINKLGSSGAKKFVVNHALMLGNNQNTDNTIDSVSSSSSSNSK